VFTTRLVDAFIIAPAAGTEQRIQNIINTGVPVTLLDRFFPDTKADCVYINNLNASGDAVKQFASLVYFHA
jgi:LacI family transcriptional regulator